MLWRKTPRSGEMQCSYEAHFSGKNNALVYPVNGSLNKLHPDSNPDKTHRRRPVLFFIRNSVGFELLYMGGAQLGPNPSERIRLGPSHAIKMNEYMNQSVGK